MKKAIFLSLFLHLLINYGYSQSIPDSVLRKDAKIYIEQTDNKFIIIDNKMILIQAIPPGQMDDVEEYIIEWEDDGNFSFINFEYNGKLLGKNIAHGRKRYLILYNRGDVALYDKNNTLIYNSYSVKYTYFSDFTVTASSELRERNVTYSANNLINYDMLMPWAEGSTSNGIGENIIFKPDWNLVSNGVVFIFSNGFVDYNRGHLYRYNNRLKKIRIYNVGYDEYSDFDFDDTPNIQRIYIDFINKIKQLRVEILDIYQGERYNDLCINLFLPFAF